MAPVPVVTRERFRMSAVPWSAYVEFSDNVGPRHVRITYDQGEMEVMTLSFGHERAKKRLGSVVEVVAEETDTDMEWSGSMTCRREDLARGLEPDECYWIQNELLVRGKGALDLTLDPPPDLALEVEISRSALDRLRVYAALGVPEVWRWDGQ